MTRHVMTLMTRTISFTRTLAVDSDGNPTDGKILIGGGYKSVAVDIYDLKTASWSLTKMSLSHFYMAAASAGPYSLFCAGQLPSY